MFTEIIIANNIFFSISASRCIPLIEISSRRNQAIRHPVPHFPPKSQGIAFSGATQRRVEFRTKRNDGESIPQPLSLTVARLCPRTTTASRAWTVNDYFHYKNIYFAWFEFSWNKSLPYYGFEHCTIFICK